MHLFTSVNIIFKELEVGIWLHKVSVFYFKVSCSGTPITILIQHDIYSLKTVDQLFLLQKRRFFRIKNRERGQFMWVQGGVEEMKSGRVVVSAQVEPMTDIWYYQDGLVKNKVTRLFKRCVMIITF